MKMDSDSWTRVSGYSRRYRSRPDAYNGEEYGGEEQKPEYLCPFCTEDFDMVGLCCHIDEDHAIEANNGICPVCARKVGVDLIRHLTVQHESLLKVQRRRRLRKVGSSSPFSIFRKEFRDGNLLSLLGGGSSFSVSSPHTESDPLLASFLYNPPSREQPLIPVEACSIADSPVENSADRTAQKAPLSNEDLKEKAQRCEFVQELLLSTFLDDDL